MVSLDGRVFDLVSSTASRVDPQSPTRFAYHEADGVLWGEYTGDTVTTGRFVGTRSGDLVHVRFVHALVTGGDPITGVASSRIERDERGGIRLVEDFDVDGVPHISVCAEVRPAP